MHFRNKLKSKGSTLKRVIFECKCKFLVSKTVKEKGHPIEKDGVSKMKLDSTAISNGPGPDYEMARRQLRRDVNELRLLAEATLRRSSKLAGLVEKYSEDMQAALDKLSREDGWQKWRVDESLRLTQVAQERISKTQNPPNCSKAKKLVCHLNYACGFGCQVRPM